jgi:hypothetical protein
MRYRTLKELNNMAPFQSSAQRGLFYAKRARGEMSAKTVAKWEKETPKKKLPYHKKKKK